MYAQVITDAQGCTLLAVSTLNKDVCGDGTKATTVAAAKQVGLVVAKRCLEQGIRRVVFDRNGFLYHGRVRALADGAREGGLEF
jgi:large subunit ribosomal protein L18